MTTRPLKVNVNPLQQDVYGGAARLDLLPIIPLDVDSILDVGCAHGDTMVELRSQLGRDARLVGVEPVEAAAEGATQSGAFDEVYHGYFPEALPTSAGNFDLICFNDVLEHVIDPWSMLEAARERLAPNGRVFASIPNIQFVRIQLELLKGRWDYTDTGILDRTHVRFFTRASIVEMFTRAGFEVEMITGINPIGQWREHQVGRVGKAAIWLTQRTLRDAAYFQFAIIGRLRSPLDNVRG